MRLWRRRPACHRMFAPLKRLVASMRFLTAFFLGMGVCAQTAAAEAPMSLPVSTVVIDSDHGPVSFKVEVAASAASEQKGLMYRTKMAPDAGMLFDFHQPQYET